MNKPLTIEDAKEKRSAIASRIWGLYFLNRTGKIGTGDLEKEVEPLEIEFESLSKAIKRLESLK